MPGTKLSVSYPLAAAQSFALIALWCVPISTALTNIALGLFAIAVLLAPELWRNWRNAFSHPVSIATFALIFALIISVLYSAAPFDESIKWLMKYRKLLFIPLLIAAFQDRPLANVARLGLCISLSFVLLLSTSNYLGLTAIGPLYNANDPITYAWVFKNHITAGLFSALLFSLALDIAETASSARAKGFYYLLSLLALVNVLVMLQGRTGQVVIIMLAIYQIVRKLRLLNFRHDRRRAAAQAVFLALLIAAASASLYFKSARLADTGSEISAYQQLNQPNATGLRLEWYRKSLELVTQRPFFGYGAMGVHEAFKQLTDGYSGARGAVTANPHNQYLLFAVELGLVGLGLFMYLLVQIARAAARLPMQSRQLLSNWLFIFTMGCLVNSLLLDISEGYMFVLLTGILIGCAHRPNTRTIINL
ncbi:O-antigen ligase [Mycoavidus sp. SF9855]|uniref:O-antigen ligase family protein n=1 Tax=Mycoavidus sp. SF9855 TaxID=2968475 RepID=UPI00211CD473|nr:O-antigen ligase family protein [Mycoavidus sp. SF9855]UUM22238.1 O-antigen ligase family protein [Mycoavidus sp. SF9855]